jgi:phosphoribosyl-ATP pyrophosphohydrolase
MGYHKKLIEKGQLGEASKIKEEFEEFWDGIEQGSDMLCLCECADLIGAIEAYIANFNLTLPDLIKMMNLTKSAFKDGSRS